MPAYLARFRCIGPACENICCGDWIIPVELESYQRYQELADPVLGPEVRQHLVQADTSKPRETARIELRQSDNRCHFLSDERLCRLQQHGGEQLLCLTCSTYPRVSNIVDGRVERAAVLSCPEIVRLALFDPKAMKLVRQREPVGRRESVASDITTATASSGDPMALSPLIRRLTVQLLSQRQASIEARLVSLGLALQELEQVAGEQAWADEGVLSKLTSANKLYEGQVHAVFQAHTRRLPAVHEQIARLEPRPAIATDLLRQLNVNQFFGARVQPAYVQRVTRIEQAASQYGDALRAVYAPYMAQRPQLMENLVVNAVYASAFPFTVGRTLYEDYAVLAVRYCFVKLHLVGAAAAEGALTDQIVVDIINVLERAVDHTPPYQQHILEVLGKQQLRDMDFVSLMLVS